MLLQDDWIPFTQLIFPKVLNLGLTVYFIIGLLHEACLQIPSNDFVGVSDQYIGYPVPEDWTGEEEHPTITGSLRVRTTTLH